MNDVAVSQDGMVKAFKLKRSGKNRRKYRKIAGFGQNAQQPALLLPFAARPTILHEGWSKNNPKNRANHE